MAPGTIDRVYQLYGITIASDVVLPIDPVGHAARVDVRFEVVEAGAFSGEPIWYHHYNDPGSGKPLISCARRSAGYLLRQHYVGDFLVSPDGADVVCRPLPEWTPGAIEDAFLDQVLPLVFNLRGSDGFHASAVQIAGQAVAFSGPSGSGKSTLAAYFYSLGYPVLTDEYLLVEDGDGMIRVRPGVPEVRLWSRSVEGLGGLDPVETHVDAYSLKHRLTLHRHEIMTESVPLDALYFLEGRAMKTTMT